MRKLRACPSFIGAPAGKVVGVSCQTHEIEPEWKTLHHDMERVREAFESELAKLDSMIRDGDWYQPETVKTVEDRLSRTPAGSAEAILNRFIDLAGRFPVSLPSHPRSPVTSIIQNFDSFIELGARLEVLGNVVDTGRALLDPSGEAVNELLEQQGIKRPGPEIREALFEVMRKAISREIHKAWRDPDEDVPKRLWERVRPEILRKTKKLVAEYGKSGQFGTADRELIPLTKRAAQRLERGGGWDAEQCVRLDAESSPAALSELATESTERQSDEQLRLLEFVEAFRFGDATTAEQELLEAIRKNDTPAEALRAVGDEDNWPRLQSLQRKIKRRLPPE